MTNHYSVTDNTMFQLVSELPQQLAESASLDGLSTLKPPVEGFDRVLLCGMGGSAIAGDLILPLLSWQKKSMAVWRDYDLPSWVDSRTLIIGQSYSGNTEESLSCVEEALKRGCPVIALTSGGTLAQMAKKTAGNNGFPLVKLPGGLPPRASLGLGVGALVRMFGILGLIQEPEQEIDSAISTLKAGNECHWPQNSNLATECNSRDQCGNVSARELAEMLSGRIPVIYTAGHEAHAAGVRLKCQLNENSKLPAFLASFPELNHNDLVGWELPEDMKEKLVLIVLQGKLENERIEARVEITRDLLSSEFNAVKEIKYAGDTILGRIMSLVQYGDFLSCYLADMTGIDPMPVHRIDSLKRALSER